VFTQTEYNKESYPIRDPASTNCTGPSKTPTSFGKRIYLEVWNRGWSRASNRKKWIEIHQRSLDQGEIEKLVGDLRSIPATNPEVIDKLRVEAGYFEKNAERMSNPEFRSQHLYYRLGRHRSRMQDRDRFPPQTIRHVLDRSQRQRHHRPALLPAQ
jgi:hypothetical protein